jgi:hypothetical protein
VVARTKQQDGEELVVTLTDARGAVIFQETCADGAHAATRGLRGDSAAGEDRSACAARSFGVTRNAR